MQEKVKDLAKINQNSIFHYKGKNLIHHSIDKAIKSKLFKKIVVVTSKKYKKKFNKYKKNQLIFVKGGKERKDSSLNALKKLKNLNLKMY